MELGVGFFLNSLLLGVGLAMDAFSVSLANGLSVPCMRKRKMCGIAGVFATFQAAMPMIGWFCVSTMARYFKMFEKCIPWIALILLGYIGGKMLYDGLHTTECDENAAVVSLSSILIQGVATSIDALSVGFTIADYNATEALLACLLIGVVTFFICFAGITIGKKAGTKLAGKAGVFGGIILICIGIEIFVTSLF